jgi:imidazolonepropionase-like amidohydrolase
VSWPPSAKIPAPAELVLDNVVVVTPGLGRAAHRRVVVQHGRISAIGPATDPDAPERYVLPGLVDMHVHLPPRLVPGLTDLFAALFLAHGVTTVREVGSLVGNPAQVASGDRLGPRVVGCGPILDGAPPAWPVARVVRSRAEGEAAVHDLFAEGALCVKVYEAIPEDAMAGIRSAASALRLPVVGHLADALPLAATSLDDVQHLCYPRCGSSSPAELEAFIEASAVRGLAHTPTLVVFEGQQILARGGPRPARPSDLLMPRFWREELWRSIVRHENPDSLAFMQSLVRRLHARGVRIHAGSDPIQPFVVPGASLHRELALLVESGLSAEEALAAATSVAGDSLGMHGVGLVSVDTPADLLVLREDPTRDLAALGSIELVVAAGRSYPIEMLRETVERQRRYLERPTIDLPLRGLARAGFAIARRAFARAHEGSAP